MKEIITTNIFLIIVLPIYITYTKFGSIEFGEFFAGLSIITTAIALFYSAMSIIELKNKDKDK